MFWDKYDSFRKRMNLQCIVSEILWFDWTIDNHYQCWHAYNEKKQNPLYDDRIQIIWQAKLVIVITGIKTWMNQYLPHANMDERK